MLVFLVEGVVKLVVWLNPGVGVGDDVLLFLVLLSSTELLLSGSLGNFLLLNIHLLVDLSEGIVWGDLVSGWGDGLGLPCLVVGHIISRLVPGMVGLVVWLNPGF